MKTVYIGSQFGDEGKSRVVAAGVKNADWSLRFQGGGNAGHTVYDDRGVKHKLHYVSAGGVFGKKVAIDTGTVVNLAELKTELNELAGHGHIVDLYISENVHLVQQSHLTNDATGSGIGSTKKGIAYVYADRALRQGIRIKQADLDLYGIDATLYRGLPPIADGEDAVFEGAQAIMLDIDYGCYPHVTSSSMMPSSAYRIDKFVGVMKGYTTRVGDGPPHHPDLEHLRAAGDEFGATTGRPRKCTWNDMDQLKYAFSIIQPDEIVVTKLDILRDVANISVYEDNKLKLIGDLDTYKQFLVETFPRIAYFSEAPFGDLIKVK